MDMIWNLDSKIGLKEMKIQTNSKLDEIEEDIKENFEHKKN